MEKKLRISNKGYDDGNGNRGDLVAEIKIVVPKKNIRTRKRTI